MAPLAITVNGDSTIYHRAERAVVNIHVSSEGTSQSEVSKNVTTTSNELQATLKTMALKDPNGQASSDAAITHWSMASLSTGSYKPVDDNGKEQPRQFTASTSFEVKFRDFSELGLYTSALSETSFVSISNISWHLTAATKETLATQSRKDAVKDAMAKAQDYAEAAGRSTVAIVEISDGQDAAPGAYHKSLRAMHMGGGAAELNFQPEDVTISCSVTAKFTAE